MHIVVRKVHIKRCINLTPLCLSGVCADQAHRLLREQLFIVRSCKRNIGREAFKISP